MTTETPVLAGDIFYEVDLPIPEQLELLRPVLKEWIGKDYMRFYDERAQLLYYRPEGAGRSITVGWNGSHGKSFHDADRFRCRLMYIDASGALSEEEYLRRLARALELLWSHGIPTCTPGWEDHLPHGGGEAGPVSWP